MKKNWIILMMLFLLALPTSGFAKHGGHGSGDLEEKYFGKVHFLFQNKAELGLTDDQLDQIKAIKFDVKRAMIDADAKKELAALDMEQELHKDQPDLAKIDSLIDQKSTIKAESAKSLVRSLLGTKAVLSAEQQAKAKELYYSKMGSMGSKCDKPCCKLDR